MSLKALYALQATILASNNLLSDAGSIDHNKIVQENVVKNAKLLREHRSDWEERITSRIWKPYLSLPVNLFIFDKYYQRLSEWKYWDKYQYDRNVLVFSKKEFESKKIEKEHFYKKDWLNNLYHLREYKYLTLSPYYTYPEKDDSQNINWIDGKL